MKIQKMLSFKLYFQTYAVYELDFVKNGKYSNND